jgi:hypothetical protein
MSGMAEKAKIIAKLAELKNAKGPDDIIAWFDSNADFIYPMVDQMLKGMATKYGIISCDKSVESDAVTFILTTQDSDIIYHGVKNMIADNSGMVKKMKAKFSVDKIDDKVVSIKIFIIPGRTESFIELINTIETGLYEYNSR